MRRSLLRSNEGNIRGRKEERIIMNTQKTITKTVTEDMLAVSVGSGTLQVLGTPVLAQLYENAAMQLAAEYCDNEFTTVGCFLSLSHDAPTPLGMEINVTVTLVKHEKRFFEFQLEASDETGIISKGSHTRVSVKSKKFQHKADDKLNAAVNRHLEQYS